MATEEKKKKEEAALSKPNETGYAIIDAPEAREVMLGAFDQLGVSNFQLNRLKIPAGGMTIFEVEELEGVNHHEHLDVLVVAVKGSQKSWWSVPVDDGGQGVPPDCASTDGHTGFGVNTLEEGAEPGEHACVKCAWNAFGSSRSGGRGKDCKDFSLLFAFRQGSRLPSLLIVPATSLKPLQKYAMSLIDAGKRMETCITRLGLEKAVSASGITYSVLSLSYQGSLDGDEAEKMVAISKDFKQRIVSSFDAYAAEAN